VALLASIPGRARRTARSSVATNGATGGSGGSGEPAGTPGNGQGGGLFWAGFTLANTLVARDTASGGIDPIGSDCYTYTGSAMTFGGNLLGDGTGCPGISNGDSEGDQAGSARVIPGSMGTRSYIVAGKGHPASWNTCSHGAGRRYSRTRAKTLFTSADLVAQMAGKVWLAKRAEAVLDEIPTAYKDIDRVMADQADLVEIRHSLRQVLNYKGT